MNHCSVDVPQPQTQEALKPTAETKRRKPPKRAMKHGILASLATGNLPTGCGWVRALVNRVKRILSQAVLDRKGKIDVHDAFTIQTACRWEQHGLMCQRWLRLAGTDLNHDQRLQYSREIARSSAERDKCLRALKLDQDSNVLEALYSPINMPDDSQDQHQHANASESKCEADKQDQRE